MFAFPFGRSQPTGHAYDPYETYYDPWTVEQRRRQQLAAERERRRMAALREEEMLRRKKQHLLSEREKQKEKERQRRMALLKKYTSAATVIQRAWRDYRNKMEQEEKNNAADVITRTVRRVAGIVSARKIIKSLKKLQELEVKLAKLVADFTATMRGYRALLFFVDAVEKLMIDTDSISHHRSQYVRLRRKSLVTEAQRALRIADVLQNTMRRKLKLIVDVLSKGVKEIHKEREHQAARVIHRFLQGMPKIRQAKEVVKYMRKLQVSEHKVKQMKQQLLATLRELSELTDEASNLSDDFAAEYASALHCQAQQAIKALDTTTNSAAKRLHPEQESFANCHESQDATKKAKRRKRKKSHKN